MVVVVAVDEENLYLLLFTFANLKIKYKLIWLVLKSFSQAKTTESNISTSCLGITFVA